MSDLRIFLLAAMGCLTLVVAIAELRAGEGSLGCASAILALTVVVLGLVFWRVG